MSLPAHIQRKLGRAKDYWLVLLKAGPKRDQTDAESRLIQEQHLLYIFGLKATHTLLMAGPVQDDKAELRGIEIFQKIPEEKLREILSNDPLVKSGRAVFEIFPWLGIPDEGLA